MIVYSVPTTMKLSPVQQLASLLAHVLHFITEVAQKKSPQKSYKYSKVFFHEDESYFNIHIDANGLPVIRSQFSSLFLCPS